MQSMPYFYRRGDEDITQRRCNINPLKVGEKDV